MKELIRHWIYKTIDTSHFIRQIEWRNMLERRDLKKGERILDVACGGLSLTIAKKGCEVHGVDLSEDAINSAKRLAERERGWQPYSYGYFDKIVRRSSLEHFKDDIKALKEMHRVLKPNGSVILTTDSFNYPIDDELKEKHRRIAYVVNYYTAEKLKERFEIAWFEMNRNKYLLSSRITSFFFKIVIELKWPGILWMAISFIAYPLCIASDGLFRVEDKGYTPIVKGYEPIGGCLYYD